MSEQLDYEELRDPDGCKARDLSQQAEALLAQKARADAETNTRPYYERGIYDALARTTAPKLAEAYLAMRWRTMDSAPKMQTIMLFTVTDLSDAGEVRN